MAQLQLPQTYARQPTSTWNRQLPLLVRPEGSGQTAGSSPDRARDPGCPFDALKAGSGSSDRRRRENRDDRTFWSAPRGRWAKGVTRGVQDLQFKLTGADDVPFGQRYRSSERSTTNGSSGTGISASTASERRRHGQPAMLDRLD